MMVTPSILSDSLETIQNQVNRVKNESKLQRVQIDIVDPEYAEEVTIHPIDLLEIDLKNFIIDIHLMTNDPINDVVECSQIPGIHTVIAQIEHMPSQKAFVEHCTSLHIQPGFSLDIYTPVDEINAYLYDDLDMVQVMGNHAGKQGESFLAEPSLEKIRELNNIRIKRKSTFHIAVDIGMTPENARLCEEVGANIVAPGSYLWKSPNIQEAIEAYSQKL